MLCSRWRSPARRTKLEQLVAPSREMAVQTLALVVLQHGSVQHAACGQVEHHRQAVIDRHLQLGLGELELRLGLLPAILGPRSPTPRV